jgi:hypothetical protein
MFAKNYKSERIFLESKRLEISGLIFEWLFYLSCNFYYCLHESLRFISERDFSDSHKKSTTENRHNLLDPRGYLISYK